MAHKFLVVLAMLVSSPSFAQTPNARLTLDPSNPVMSADTTSATLYYTDTTLKSVSLSAQPNGVYDVYESAASGNLVLGPIWTGNTPPIADTYPAMTNAAAFTTSETCDVGQCTLLGAVDVVGGQITCNFAYGPAQQCGVWNYWNRQPYVMKVGAPDPGAPSSPYWQPIYQPSYAPLFGVQGSVLVGRPEFVRTQFTLTNWMQVTTGSAQELLGIGWDRTSQPSGFQGTADIEQTATNIDLGLGGMVKMAKFSTVTEGLHSAYPLFKTQNVVTGCVPNVSPSCIYMAKGEDNWLLEIDYEN